MGLRVTVLHDADKFCTLVDGELNFWVVVAGIPTSVQDSELFGVTEWTLDQEGTKQ